MTNLSPYAQQVILNHMLRGQRFEPPLKFYLAVFVEDTQDRSRVIEVNTSDYKRMEISFTAPQNGVCENFSDILWLRAKAHWGNAAVLGVFDAQTRGNLWFSALVLNPDGQPEPMAIGRNQQFSVRQGEFTVSLTAKEGGKAA